MLELSNILDDHGHVDIEEVVHVEGAAGRLRGVGDGVDGRHCG